MTEEKTVQQELDEVRAELRSANARIARAEAEALERMVGAGDGYDAGASSAAVSLLHALSGALSQEEVEAGKTLDDFYVWYLAQQEAYGGLPSFPLSGYLWELEREESR